MTRFRWLTPDGPPADMRCLRVFCPDSDDCAAALFGALVALGKSYNWEEYGSASAEETAAVFRAAFLKTVQGGLCMPIGAAFPYTGSGTPANCLEANGQEVNQADYPELFAVIGGLYGSAAPGAFKLPDLRGRVAVGSSSLIAFTATGGQSKVTLTESQIPSHTHTTHGHVPAMAQLGVGEPVSIPSILSDSTGSSGGGQEHENMPPYLALRWMVVAK